MKIKDNREFTSTFKLDPDTSYIPAMEIYNNCAVRVSEPKFVDKFEEDGKKRLTASNRSDKDRDDELARTFDKPEEIP